MVKIGKWPQDVAKSQNAMIEAVTRGFLQENPHIESEDDSEIIRVYMDTMREAFVDWNTKWGTVDIKKSDASGLFVIRHNGGWGGIMYPKELPDFAVAELLRAKYKFVALDLTGDNGLATSMCALAIYAEDGEYEGIYVTDDDYKKKIFRRYAPSLSDQKFVQIEDLIRVNCPVVKRCDNPWLVPVRNGIWNAQTRTLMPFTSELVFTSKAQIAYNPNATNVTIQNPDGTSWDFESWIASVMSDVDEDKNALLYSMQFCIRPISTTHKSMLWISDNIGNSGKGTCAQIVEDILGAHTVKKVDLTSITEKFALYDLPYKSLLIGYDNDFKKLLEDTNVLKLLATHEPVPVRQKFKDEIMARFYGENLQLTNSYPKLSDRSDSFLRRWWGLEFKKEFVESDGELPPNADKSRKDKKYIKEDYLRRQEVLEYILKRLLEMDFLTELPTTENTKQVGRKILQRNNPLIDFVEEVINAIPDYWDKYPARALYLLYDVWYIVNKHDIRFKLKNQNFYDDLAQALRKNGKWEYCEYETLNANSDKMKQIYDRLTWDVVAELQPADFRDTRGDLHNLPINSKNEFKTQKGCIVRKHVNRGVA